MVRKVFVIDTNVFVHDPSALNKFEDNDVVIPLPVLEELGSLKKETSERGKNAREIMRFIDSLKLNYKGDFIGGIILPEGPKVRVFLQLHKEAGSAFPLPLDRNSNKILLIAYLLKKENENTVFVSKDFISRVKAEALGIQAQDYESLKVSYGSINKGLRRLQVDKNEIDLFYKDGSVSLADKKFFANEYCILNSPENSSALCRFDSKTNNLKPLMSTSKKIWGILPLNAEQKCAIDLLLREDIPLVTLMGPAGTGKTLLALACALRQVFDEGVYSKVLVSRPIIPLGRDIGYLPGTKKEKLSSWMQPIYDNLEFLCRFVHEEGEENSALNFILESNKLEMEAVTYIRGRTLPKIFMIIDEAQNLTPHEVKTIVSRAGVGTKVVFTGDPTQIDNPYLDKDSNGMSYILSRFIGQNLYGQVFLNKSERSELAALAADIM